MSVPSRSYLLYDGYRVDIPNSTGGEYFAVINNYNGRVDTNLTYKTIVDYFVQTRPGYRKIAEVLETYMRHSREFIYNYPEDEKREEVDKINFMSNIIINKVDIPANDDLAVLRLLKQVFVDKSLGEGLAKHFARYNMFAGEFPTDTVIIENTRNQATLVYNTAEHDPKDFERIGRYPFIGLYSKGKLVFYEVIKTKVNGKQVYFARESR